MITNILYALAGAFLGWNLPQPAWASALQTKIADWFTTRLF